MRLRRWNLGASIWHFVLALCISVLHFSTTPTFTISFNKMWAKRTEFPDFLNSTMCDGDDYAVDPRGLSGYLECNREKDEEWAEYARIDDVFRSEIEPGPEIKVTWLLLAFELLTACSHGLLWKYSVLYEKALACMLQPMRWLEYSITSSIMFWCVLSLSRVQDLFLLCSLFLNSFFLNFVGGLVFECCYFAERAFQTLANPYDSARPLHHTSRTHPTKRSLVTPTNTKQPPYFVAGIPKTGRDGKNTLSYIQAVRYCRLLKWTCFVVSWLGYAINLWTLFDAYFSGIDPYLRLGSRVLWEDLFNVATWGNVGLAVTFTSFPILHAWVFDPLGLLKRRTHDQRVSVYKQGERGFIVLSFVSKTLLVVTIGAAAFMRND